MLNMLRPNLKITTQYLPQLYNFNYKILQTHKNRPSLYYFMQDEFISYKILRFANSHDLVKKIGLCEIICK